MALRLTFFLAFALAMNANAQCSQKLELKKVYSRGNVGELVLNVNTNSAFTASLLEMGDGANKTIVTRTGTGSQTVDFKNIKASSYYKIIVEFEGEEKFLCKTKVFTNIRLTDN